MQKVLVTGATSGIGRAIAITLHRAGYVVTATGRNADSLAQLSSEVPGIETLCLDLSDQEAVQKAMAKRTVDVLVNNAGVMPKPGQFTNMDFGDIEQTFDVNVKSVLWLTHLLLPQMRERQSGHVVFTGSSAAHAPGANFAAYAASKAAIAAFASAIRAEVTHDGVRVTELVPGRVETGLYNSVLDPKTRSDMYEGGVSLQPEDIADAVLGILKLPPRANVTRLDVMPTRPVPAIAIK